MGSEKGRLTHNVKNKEAMEKELRNDPDPSSQREADRQEQEIEEQ